MKGKVNGGQFRAERGDHFRGDFPMMFITVHRMVGLPLAEVNRLLRVNSSPVLAVCVPENGPSILKHP